jgi:uncharacterized protein YndB with AHSA1/START domain
MKTVNFTSVNRTIKAPRAAVYNALIDANAISGWKVPNGMSIQVHSFDGREGGKFRISLTYVSPTGAGKTTAHTDTYHGYFVKLVPNEQVVEIDEFETINPEFKGQMKTTINLVEADGGTEVITLHEGLPPGVPIADNEAGWREALSKLADMVEK